jgi:hypothetical protein
MDRKSLRKAILVPGDIQDPAHCRSKIVETAVGDLGGVDVLVNNAAHQASFKEIGDIPDEEWQLTFAVNIHAVFYLTKAAVPHMRPGSCIINTASMNADKPNPTLLALCDDQGCYPELHRRPCAIAGGKGHQGNRGRAGPDLDAVDPLDHDWRQRHAVPQAGADEAAGTACGAGNRYVMLADPMSSYVSGAPIAVTAGHPIIYGIDGLLFFA